jgi:energy-coupling factor transporter ATP-binding protein EcfA2
MLFSCFVLCGERMTLLLGPPSSGKSTLLLALAGKLDPQLKVTLTSSHNQTSCLIYPIIMFCIILVISFTFSYSDRKVEKWPTMELHLLNFVYKELLLISVRQTTILENWQWGKHYILLQNARVQVKTGKVRLPFLCFASTLFSSVVITQGHNYSQGYE